MNEPLCRALVGAGLGEEDVAARLGVDTKTVRRWLEGRVPYRRHRWALAMLLQASDADLWPQLRGGSGRPREVRAVYPHRDDVPAAEWLRPLGSARREIGILDRDGMFLAAMPGGLEALGERAGAGVRVRVCLCDPGTQADPDGTSRAVGDGAGEALSLLWPLRGNGDVQIRVHRDDPYVGLCVADEQMFVVQYAYGIAPGRSPVMHLESCGRADLFAIYLESFERVWQAARPYAGGVRPV